MKKDNSSVIRQKGESQNEGFKKTKHAKFSAKQAFLTSWHPHVRVRIRGVRNVCFQKIYPALFSWNTRFEICPFALLPTNCNYPLIPPIPQTRRIDWLKSAGKNCGLSISKTILRQFIIMFCLLNVEKAIANITI